MLKIIVYVGLVKLNLHIEKPLIPAAIYAVVYFLLMMLLGAALVAAAVVAGLALGVMFAIFWAMNRCEDNFVAYAPLVCAGCLASMFI